MTALPKQLREHVSKRGGATFDNGAWQMMLDAADEIERLTEERNALYESLAGRAHPSLLSTGRTKTRKQALDQLAQHDQELGLE